MSDGMLCTFAHCVTCHIICLLAWQAILCIPQFHLPVLLLYHNARHFNVGSSVAPAVFWMMLLLFLLCCCLSS